MKSKIYLTALTALGFYHISSAQAKEWQTWTSIKLKVPFSKKVDFSVNQLAAFSPSNSYAVGFTQTSAAVSVNVSKKVSLAIGDQLTNIPVSNNPLRNRIYLRGTVSNKVVKFLKLRNSLQAELHGKNEPRYQQRYIFTNSLSLRRRFSALALRPSIAYSLYYNAGGRELQYFDKSGNPTVMQTPDGFHRGRFSASLNSRVSRRFQLTVFYRNQNEFNFLTGEGRNINVVNPATGKISRPYNNFQAIGLSLQFSIR